MKFLEFLPIFLVPFFGGKSTNHPISKKYLSLACQNEILSYQILSIYNKLSLNMNILTC